MKKFYDCTCHSADHAIYLETDIAEGQPQYDTIMAGVQLAPLLPWYKRVGAALRYIVNPHGDYSHWHDTLLTPEQVFDMYEQLHQFMEAHQRNEEARS